MLFMSSKFLPSEPTKAPATEDDNIAQSGGASVVGRRFSMVAALATLFGAKLLATPTKKTGGNTALAIKAAPSISIRAPRDCYVATLLVANNTQVATGTRLLSIDTGEEDRALERVGLAEQILSLQAESVSDAQIEIRRQVLNSTVDIAKAYLQYSGDKVFTLQLEIDTLGTTFNDPNTPKLTLGQAKAAFSRAQAELSRATLSLSLFETNVSQVRKKLALISAAITKEREALSASKARLTIQAPTDGHIVFLCTKGIFVSKGDVLAELRS
jgi:multidrug resistance efflux pump